MLPQMNSLSFHTAPSKPSLYRSTHLCNREKLCNTGVSCTVTALPQAYWIPTIRQYVKKILKNVSRVLNSLVSLI